MGTESFLITFLAVVYGYHALVLLFGTSHCLSILLGEYLAARPVTVQTAHLLPGSALKAYGLFVANDEAQCRLSGAGSSAVAGVQTSN